jgi:hypothetical protein
MNEPVPKDVITQNNLPAALKDGRISQAEVDDVWRQTEFLSAQTPIEVRRAVIALKKDGNEVRPVEQVLLQVMMDLRASLFRDESKFAHLVAGTETIVDKLQRINEWEALVESLKTRLDETNILVSKLVEQHEADRQRNERMRKALRVLMAEDESPPPYEADDPWGPGSAKPINFDDDPYVAEPEPEEEYDRKIGSNWSETNPRKR